MIAGGLALLGVVHSPLPSSPVLLPDPAMAQLRDPANPADLGRFEAARGQTPYHWAAGYFLMAGATLVIGSRRRDEID